jgi:M6 family metalloprotease-like protein
MKRLLPFLLILLFVLSAGCGQGPARQGPRGQPAVTTATPAVIPPAGTATGTTPAPVTTAATIAAAPCTTLHPVVILVDFPDVETRVDRAQVEQRFSQQLNAYLQEMSYGKVCLDADVTTKWYTLPHPVSEYRISSRNLEVNKTRVRNLIEDALDAADADVNYPEHSFTVLFLAANTTEYGMVGLNGYPGMLGWTVLDEVVTSRGEKVPGGVAIYTYTAHLGTLFHDIAHIMGGVKDGKRQVPCLYDHDMQALPGPDQEIFKASIINMGYWDPMSCHYIEFGVPPPGITSWTRMRLGWLDPAKVKTVQKGERAEVLLGPLEDASSETLVIKIPLTATTYYLIENRQPIGVDRYLPDSGVLILYADDSIPECRNGQAPVKLMNADPSVPSLKGAAYDADVHNEFVDDRNGIRIRVAEKIGESYRIVVGLE